MPEDVLQPDTSYEKEVTVVVEIKEEELVKTPVDEEEEILTLFPLPIFTFILIVVGTITGISCFVPSIIDRCASESKDNKVSNRPKKLQSRTDKLTPKADAYDTGDTDIEK